MRTDLAAPGILQALAILARPSMLIVVAVLGPTILLLLQFYFRTCRAHVAHDSEAAFAADPRLSSAWNDLDREYSNLCDTYRRGRSQHRFRVNRKSDWRFDQRRHAAAEANRDVDALFARFYEAQHIARILFANWKWQAAGMGAADIGTLAYIIALLVLLLTIGNGAFPISGAIALATLVVVWIGYALLLTPGEQHRIVSNDVTWETLAHAYEASEEGAES